jgi:glutamate synthase domain-containing protein 3
MNTKLTLNLNKNVIESAKDYAKENRISLSKLIESYLNSLTKKQQKEIKVSSLVESLTGIIPKETEQKNNDDYYDYLNKKYS